MRAREAIEALARHRGEAVAVCALGMAANEWWAATRYSRARSASTPPTGTNGKSGNGSRNARRYETPPSEAGNSLIAAAP